MSCLAHEKTAFARRVPSEHVRPDQKAARKRKMQRLAVELITKHPEFTQIQVASWLSMSRQTLGEWLKEPKFRARFDGARKAAAGEEPPAVPSFEEFRLKYLNAPDYNPTTGRKMMVGTTHPYMRGFVEALEDPDKQRVMCLWPVRFAKTTTVEQYAVYRLAKNPNARIVIVCSSERHAKERALAIKRILTDADAYPELHQDYGAWLGKPHSKELPWGAREFYVRGRTSPQRSPSVACYGIDTEAYGARADLIILDDVDSPTKGPAERQTILQNINTVLINRLNEGGKIAFIGTRCAVIDVASSLRNRPGWWSEVLSALQEDGSSLCEEMYTASDLRFFREDLGEIAFQLTFQNNPAPEGSMVFPPDLITLAKDPTFRVGDAPEGWRRIAMLDPATGGRAACIPLAFGPEKQKRVLDVDVRYAPRHDGLAGMVERALVRHRAKVIICEEQGAGQLSKDFPEILDLIYSHGAEFESFKTGMNKHDPKMGVPLVATEMQRGRLRLPDATPEDENVMRPLIEDMLNWQPTPQTRQRFDTVMALWFGCSWLARGEDEYTSLPPSTTIANRLPWLQRQQRTVTEAQLQEAMSDPMKVVEVG